jgi:putative transposase
MALLDLVRQYQDDAQVDALREGVRLLVEAFMEAGVRAQVGADRYERTPERRTYRNGYRQRPWDTRAATTALRIPKLRQGSYFPSPLQPRRRAEWALLSMVQEAHVAGASTRKVDDVARALGLEGISPSEVSHICGQESMRKLPPTPAEDTMPAVAETV